MAITAPFARPGPKLRLGRTLLAAVATTALLGAAAAPAALAAPANDAFATATPVSALPFSDTTDMSGATVETDEPQFCSYSQGSVWYAYTPSSNATLSASTLGSTAPAQLNVYRQDGSGLSGLSFVGCQNFGFEPVVFRVEAGTTYFVQGSLPFGPSGQLSLELKTVTPPANDDFADATAVGAVPFVDHPLLSAASAEEGEPSGCAGAGQKTVWYAFTPTETNSYIVDRSGSPTPLGVYTGSSLGSLDEVTCASYSAAIFRAQAGRTYFLQLASGFFNSMPIDFSVRVAPPAQASFFYYPGDPSAFDTVQFYDSSYDIAQIASRLWGFGDGASATDCCPAHRYGADGTYDAKLSITTNDGRTASTTQPISVKTHDVAIVGMSVPVKARVGRSVQLSVEVSNTRYAENVEVALMRSLPGGGFERVGQVTQGVPVRKARRTTTFSVSYTVAPEDATIGKVTFQAVATIVGARDAHPADNTVVAVPMKIRD